MTLLFLALAVSLTAGVPIRTAVVGSSTALTNSVSSYNPQPSIAWWKGNTGSGTTDADSSSGSAGNLTISNSSAWGTTFTGTNTGGSSTDLVFNNLYNAQSASTINYASNTTITFLIRIKETTFASGVDEMYMQSGGNPNSGAGRWMFYNDFTNSTLSVQISDSSSNHSLFTIPRPSNATWHCIEGVISTLTGVVPQIWVDGTPQTVTTGFDLRSTNGAFSTNTVYIGIDSGGTRQTPSSNKDFRIFAGSRAADQSSDNTNYP